MQQNIFSLRELYCLLGHLCCLEQDMKGGHEEKHALPIQRRSGSQPCCSEVSAKTLNAFDNSQRYRLQLIKSRKCTVKYIQTRKNSMYMYVKVLRDIEKWKQLKAEWLGKLSCIHSMAYRSFLKGASEECIITFY